MNKNTIRFVIYTLFAIICITFLIIRLCCINRANIIYEFGTYSFAATSVYYIIMFLLDFLQQFCGKTFDKASSFFNKQLFKFIWVMEMTTLLGFWGGVALDWTKKTTGTMNILVMIGFHGVVQILLLIDTFMFTHSLKTSYLCDVTVLSVIYVTFATLVLFKRYLFGNSQELYQIFPFMNKPFDVILTIGVIYYMLLLNMYFLHQFVLMKKMKVSFGSTTVTEKNNTTKKVKNDKKESLL